MILGANCGSWVKAGLFGKGEAFGDAHYGVDDHYLIYQFCHLSVT
jgi:hypothetical protein